MNHGSLPAGDDNRRLPPLKKTLLGAIAGLALALGAGSAQAGATLDGVKSRGILTCGVNVGVAGFSLPDSRGIWQGMDADLCRGVAAAVLGDPSKVRFVPLTAVQRFPALQSGEIDVLIRQTTLSMTRDTSLGMRLTAVNLYDGHGFIVKKSANIANLRGLGGAPVRWDKTAHRYHPVTGCASASGATATA